ncbi:MAG: BTAD domain-containing putative transcriptional regulator [Burkholderiaceae bacterium]
MTPNWTLRLLGEPAIESPDGSARALPLARKGMALLAHVAVHGDAGVHRGALLALLWDGHRPEDARNALRQCLHQVRLALGDASGILANAGDRIALDESRCTVDVRRFEALAARPDAAALSTAVGLYRGDFSPGLEGGAEFSHWAAQEREHLRHLAHRVVARISESDPGTDTVDEAIGLARRLLAAEATHEETSCALMRLYARAGLRAQALRAWADCRRALRDELGVEPGPRVAALAADLFGPAAASSAPAPPPEPNGGLLPTATPPGSGLRAEEDPEVLDLMLRGWQLFTLYSADSNAKAARIYSAVLERAPHHVIAMTQLGWTHWFAAISGWTGDPHGRYEQAKALAERALACTDASAPSHGLMGKVLLWQKRHDEAIAHLQRAVALAPGHAYMHFHLGDALTWSGRPAEAAPNFDCALRLDPNDHGVFLAVYGLSRWMAGDATQASALADRAVRRNPSYCWSYGLQAVLHYEAGAFALARRAAVAGRRLNRRFSVRFASDALPFLHDEHRQRYSAAWRASGLPEEDPTAAAA